MILFVLLTTGFSSSAAQEVSVVRRENDKAVTLTGNVRIDLIGMTNLESPLGLDQASPQSRTSRKSPWLAAGLSLVLPGAGQFYAESYVKSAIFLVIEAAAWTFAYTQDRKGDRQTDAFQNFADRNWSAVQYAEYAEATYNPPGGPFNWRIPGTEGLPPWQQVDWSELNRLERAIGGNSANAEGRYFSHTLPPYGEQQYYELIGKYPQYNTGWNDAMFNPGDFQYGDPLSPNFLYYSDERGKANTFYNRATTAVTVAVINHVLSALDAGWSASSYNTVHAKVEMQTRQLGFAVREVPVLRVAYSF